jgi:hypothetical protein
VINLADLGKELRENNILLVIVSKNAYSSKSTEILRALQSISNKISYVSFNHPYNSLIESVRKNGIDPSRLFIIDTVTASVQQPKPQTNCIFISAPNALTEISVAFSKSINQEKCDSALFDSLSALLVYESANSIIMFAHNIITKLKISNSRAVFLVLKEDIDGELMKDLYMFVDKVVELE